MIKNLLGLNVGLVLQTACQEQNVDPEVRNRIIDILARHVDDALRYQRELIKKNKNVFLFALVSVGRIYGAYVTTIYTFIKFLHLTNCIFQFYFLNKFLETSDYPLFGGHVLYDLLRVKIFTNLKIFKFLFNLNYRIANGKIVDVFLE